MDGYSHMESALDFIVSKGYKEIYYISLKYNDKSHARLKAYSDYLKKGKTKPVKEYTMKVIPLIIVLVIIWNIIESPLFMASKYAKRIEIDTGKNFSTDISEVDFSKLPLLDKKSSQALGDRVMGQMRDLVSQYNVSNIYTQINYNKRIIRVTPLEYASPIKW